MVVLFNNNTCAVSLALRYVKSYDISGEGGGQRLRRCWFGLTGKLLLYHRAKNLIMIDIDGCVREGRPSEMDIWPYYPASVSLTQHCYENRRR